VCLSNCQSTSWIVRGSTFGANVRGSGLGPTLHGRQEATRRTSQVSFGHTCIIFSRLLLHLIEHSTERCPQRVEANRRLSKVLSIHRIIINQLKFRIHIRLFRQFFILNQPSTAWADIKSLKSTTPLTRTTSSSSAPPLLSITLSPLLSPSAVP
jgi:hypothetical protein